MCYTLGWHRQRTPIHMETRTDTNTETRTETRTGARTLTKTVIPAASIKIKLRLYIRNRCGCVASDGLHPRQAAYVINMSALPPAACIKIKLHLNTRNNVDVLLQAAFIQDKLQLHLNISNKCGRCSRGLHQDQAAFLYRQPMRVRYS